MKKLDKSKKIFITGAAGFIGFHLSQSLLKDGYTVIGIDSLNHYYDVNLKYQRLGILKKFLNFVFIEGNIANKQLIMDLFKQHHPHIVMNLAAQPGVRYSIENPDAYIESNIIGFYNILEACRFYPVDHLVYASSSSVYGNRKEVPFHVTDNVDEPISLYAATKKSNELMAYTYSHLYHIPVTGLRFFTVYGPYGRPDMAYFSFSNKIMNNEPIKVFNNGDMLRDFTYIDDIIIGIRNILPKVPLENHNGDRYKIYNIGNHKPVTLMEFITTLEQELKQTARKEYLPMQPGDVYQTYADVNDLIHDFGFKPRTSLKKGLHEFVMWYQEYRKKSK